MIWVPKSRYLLLFVLLIFSASCGNSEGEPFNPCKDLTADPSGNISEGLKVSFATDKDAYAAGQNVQLSLTVTNVSDAPKTLTFTSSQKYDFVACKDNVEIWKWSHDKAFLTVMTEQTLQPGQSLSYPEIWNRTDNAGKAVPSGNYTVYGISTSSPQSYSNRKVITLE